MIVTISDNQCIPDQKLGRIGQFFRCRSATRKSDGFMSLKLCREWWCLLCPPSPYGFIGAVQCHVEKDGQTDISVASAQRGPWSVCRCWRTDMHGDSLIKDHHLGWWDVSSRELFIFLLCRRRYANQYNYQKIAKLETTHQPRPSLMVFTAWYDCGASQDSQEFCSHAHGQNTTFLAV